jgi:hypothetical protein
MGIRGGRSQIDFDAMMRHLAVVGSIALGAWTAIGAVTVPTGILTVSPQATLRFLLAVLILVFARRTYWEIREWHWRKLPPDERFGFASPLGEYPRARGADLGFETPAASTGVPQPQG